LTKRMLGRWSKSIIGTDAGMAIGITVMAMAIGVTVMATDTVRTTDPIIAHTAITEVTGTDARIGVLASAFGSGSRIS
jgi:hypothetical protein